MLHIICIINSKNLHVMKSATNIKIGIRQIIINTDLNPACFQRFYICAISYGPYNMVNIIWTI